MLLCVGNERDNQDAIGELGADGPTKLCAVLTIMTLIRNGREICRALINRRGKAAALTVEPSVNLATSGWIFTELIAARVARGRVN